MESYLRYTLTAVNGRCGYIKLAGRLTLSDLWNTCKGKLMSESTLYERLGGEENIRKIATTLFDTHADNKTINARYVNSDRNAVIQLVFEFLCSATGGSQEYTGRDMLTTHKGMNISEEEFMAVLDDLLTALQANGIGQREQEELLLANYNLRRDIVRV